MQWTEEFANYNFTIKYFLGTKNIIANLLSHCLDHAIQALITHSSSFLDQVQAAYKTDIMFADVVDMLKVSLSFALCFQYTDGLLFY